MIVSAAHPIVERLRTPTQSHSVVQIEVWRSENSDRKWGSWQSQWLILAFACTLQADSGSIPTVAGGGNIRRYYYNSITGNCEQFSYAGTGGNANNFETKDFCESYCKTGKAQQSYHVDVPQTYHTHTSKIVEKQNKKIQLAQEDHHSMMDCCLRALRSWRTHRYIVIVVHPPLPLLATRIISAPLWGHIQCVAPSQVGLISYNLFKNLD